MHLYLALLLENGKEPSAWEYRRCAVEMGPNGSNLMNTEAVTFPFSRCRWGRVVAIGLTDDLDGGEMLKIALPEAMVVDTCEQLEIPAHSILLRGLRDNQITIWKMLKEGVDI